MAKKVVAIVGSYRKGGTVDTAVDAVLAGARERGADTNKIYLLDQHIEYCRNCRACTQAEGMARGECAIHDDMAAIFDEIESADAVVLGSPVNFYNVTAVFRTFLERLLGCVYWPWGQASPNRDRRRCLVRRCSSRRRRPRAFCCRSPPELRGRCAWQPTAWVRARWQGSGSDWPHRAPHHKSRRGCCGAHAESDSSSDLAATFAFNAMRPAEAGRIVLDERHRTRETATDCSCWRGSRR